MCSCCVADDALELPGQFMQAESFHHDDDGMTSYSIWPDHHHTELAGAPFGNIIMIIIL
jgi:hypothetical protein